MLQSIWGLTYEGEVLGVRVLRDGVYYDVDLVNFKNVKINPSALPCLPLMEYDDELMTEDEIFEGLEVEDGSVDQGIISDLKKYFDGNDVLDPKEKARIKKKLEEYTQKYYTYLPNNWLKAFAQYHLDTFEGNRNVYSGFTTQQTKVIQQYFRWRSKMVFEEHKQSNSLKKGLNKAKQLRHIMGDADDWLYDGTVDTGFRGGSHCELGHALRYEHYAYSPSLNKHIVFGETCFTDFFELDKRVIDTIIKAQETVLKEIKAIAFILRTGRYAEYRPQYANFREVLQYLDSETEYTRGLAQFMTSFDNQGLPLTRSMLMKFNDLVRDFEKNKNFHDVLQVVGSSVDPQLLQDVINGRYATRLAHVLRVHVLYDPSKHKKFIKQGMEILPALQVFKARVSTQVSLASALLSAKKELYFIKDGSSPRLATVEEVASSAEGLFKSTLLPSDKLTMLEWLSDNVQNYNMSSRGKSIPKLDNKDTDYATDFVANWSLIKKAMTWACTDGFIDEMRVLRETKGQAGSSLGSSTSSGATTNDSSSTQSIPAGYAPFDDLLEADINRIIEAGATGQIAKNDFVFQIIDTVKKNKRMSPKQKKYIDAALIKIRQIK